MADPLTPAEMRSVWEEKAVLRTVYAEYFQLIRDACLPGVTVEIGAGPGNLKNTIPTAISSDITYQPWLDLAADAQCLPFPARSVANLVGVDVIHHVEVPRLLLEEAARVLRPGGRVILVEPAITPVSWVFYKLFHPEPINLGADPLASGTTRPDRHPMDANQAIPTLLTRRRARTLERELPALRCVRRQRMSLFAYPLSGGFRPWSLVPSALLDPLLRVERRLTPVLGPAMAFRLFLVLERVGGDAS